MKDTYSLLHIAVILAAFTGIFGKLITLNEGLLVCYRVLFSAIILFILTKCLKIKSSGTWKTHLPIAKVGILITIHWLFFYASIKYSNISIGVVCYCLTSSFTAILKPIIDKTKFKFSELSLSGLTLLGISLIFHFDTSYQLGIFLGILSSAFAALYTIYNERLVKKYDSISINYYQMVAGSIFLLIIMPFYILAFPVKQFIPSAPDFLYLLLLSLCCTVGLYIAVSEVLKKITAFTVNLTFNLEPIYAIILAFLFFGEGQQLKHSFYIGLLFIITSVILQTLLSLKKQNIISKI